MRLSANLQNPQFLLIPCCLAFACCSLCLHTWQLDAEDCEAKLVRHLGQAKALPWETDLDPLWRPYMVAGWVVVGWAVGGCFRGRRRRISE